MINSDGKTMHTFLKKAQPRNTLFTGSSRCVPRWRAGGGGESGRVLRGTLRYVQR